MKIWVPSWPWEQTALGPPFSPGDLAVICLLSGSAVAGPLGVVMDVWGVSLPGLLETTWV